MTDITQFDGIRLIASYWSTIKPDKNYDIIFVGDVHGDINQFLAPLVMSGLISISDEVQEIKHNNKSSIIYVPKYTINRTKTKIVYLGDIVDEWIFSRSISFILLDLLKTCPKNVFYIYGNHDLAIIGRYHLFKQKQLNIALDIPALWQTLKSELNHIKNLKMYKTIAELDGEPAKGYEYIYNYVEPLFDNMFEIFNNQLGRVSLSIEINHKPYMLSHTTWTIQAIQQLISNNEKIADNKPDARPSDTNTEQLKPVINNKIDISDEIKYIESIITNKTHEKIDYNKLSNSVNKVFHQKSRLYISKNLLTYTRLTKNIFLNHIIGHSAGGEFRDQSVNVSQSTYNNERKEKLKPDFINGRTVYYFDFGCSAGYDHDEIGRPDFVYSNDKGLYVSNLPAFSFIISNGKDSLLVMTDKTPRSPNKIIFN